MKVLILVVALAAVEEANKAQQLMEADKAFAQETAQRGLDGWLSYYAEDAVRLELKSGQHVQGLDGIRKMDAPMFADESVKVRWAPTASGMYRSGDLGFTTGKYQVVKIVEDADDVVMSKGRYLTIWRQDDGKWKVILDTGTEDQEPKTDTPE